MSDQVEIINEKEKPSSVNVSVGDLPIIYLNDNLHSPFDQVFKYADDNGNGTSSSGVSTPHHPTTSKHTLPVICIQNNKDDHCDNRTHDDIHFETVNRRRIQNESREMLQTKQQLLAGFLSDSRNIASRNSSIYGLESVDDPFATLTSAKQHLLASYLADNLSRKHSICDLTASSRNLLFLPTDVSPRSRKSSVCDGTSMFSKRLLSLPTSHVDGPSRKNSFIQNGNKKYCSTVAPNETFIIPSRKISVVSNGRRKRSQSCRTPKTSSSVATCRKSSDSTSTSSGSKVGGGSLSSCTADGSAKDMYQKDKKKRGKRIPQQPYTDGKYKRKRQTSSLSPDEQEKEKRHRTIVSIIVGTFVFILLASVMAVVTTLVLHNPVPPVQTAAANHSSTTTTTALTYTTRDTANSTA